MSIPVLFTKFGLRVLPPVNIEPLKKLVVELPPCDRRSQLVEFNLLQMFQHQISLNFKLMQQQLFQTQFQQLTLDCLQDQKVTLTTDHLMAELF
jgi:hypothetical protein